MTQHRQCTVLRRAPTARALGSLRGLTGYCKASPLPIPTVFFTTSSHARPAAVVGAAAAEPRRPPPPARESAAPHPSPAGGAPLRFIATPLLKYIQLVACTNCRAQLVHATARGREYMRQAENTWQRWREHRTCNAHQTYVQRANAFGTATVACQTPPHARTQR
jgi:hypothetical protein